MAVETRGEHTARTEPAWDTSVPLETAAPQRGGGLLRVAVGRVTGALVVVMLLLALASLSLDLHRAHAGLQDVPGLRLHDLDEEGNLPTFFSSLLLAFSALLLLCIGFAVADSEAREGRPWKALGAVFLYLAADEASRIHEYGCRLDALWLPDWGILNRRWVILGALFVLAMAAAFLPFVLRLPRDTRRRVLVAGAVFVGGALGVEMACAATFDAWAGTPAVIVLRNIEEVLEMLGIILFINALLRHIGVHLGGLCVRVGVGLPPPAAPPAVS
ncbi:MAG: hypothetical protein FJX74_16550 [Armatimonadetes bacterium]|nr:hypothetical protein [Armatimonadota bacterium]